MQELLLKCVRWYIVVAFVIGGIGLLHFSDKYDTIKTVLPGLVCLGIAFIFGTAWKDLRRKTLFWAIVIVTGLAWISQFVQDIFYVMSGSVLEPNYFASWAVLSLIVGFPAMMYVFHKYGD